MPRQHLTPNACLVCRKKRTKCDGQMPCRRCRSRGEECAYEDKKWRTKDHLRSEIERLRAEQRQGHALIRALTDNDPKQCEVVFSRMRNEEPPEVIADWIYSMRCLSGVPRRSSQGAMDGARFGNATGAFGLPSGMCPEPSPSERLRAGSLSSLSTLSFSQSGTSFDGTPRSSLSSDSCPTSRFAVRATTLPPSSMPIFNLNSFALNLPPQAARNGMPVPPLPVPDEPILRTWTNVTSDAQLVQRLLSKFFSGSFPSLSLVSSPQFMRDFREGSPRFCSEALVNAILGSACKSYDTTSKLVSRVTYGDAFLGEAKRLLGAEQSHVNLPSIQALGVLALTEISQGNDDEAWDLAWGSIRACIHMVLQTQHQDHQIDSDFRVVRALAYCGGFTVIRNLRLLTGRLEPKTGPLFMQLQLDSGDLGDDGPQVRVERGIALQMKFFAELHYCPPLAKFIFEVTEVVHTFSAYNFSKAMTAEDLEGAYDKCLDYYGQFSASLGVGLDSSPDLLFAQIWYHFCLLTLLRPFVKGTASLKDDVPLRLRNGATPQLVCRQSSEAVIYLTSTYQTRFSLTYLPALLPHMVFAAVLYQLTLAVDPQYASHQTAIAKSPVISFNAKPSCMPRPQSPVGDIHLRKASRRRDSGLSTTSSLSTQSSISSSSDQSSVSGVTSRGASERESSSETSSNLLPRFTSEPADLVTIGSLQLASMGAQHPDAAEAAHLLRSLGSVRDLTGSNVNLASLAYALPFPMNEFMASSLLTGLGLQKPTTTSMPPPPGPGSAAPPCPGLVPGVLPGYRMPTDSQDEVAVRVSFST
ncbi:putative C6-zinc finger TF, regulator of conidiation [Podospora appendiculata]|uniref:C6-zinc finger TF, regulator of conidiation n=1 Tax=Podospora appendiculata TaxID=314037 RepID=A0AAE1C9D3_9PEZI|nr:putative C6-zinc finger TF, regulator of conidiation [Podospora appendiculata]